MRHKLIEGPVVIAGNWEPLIFRRRMNSPYADLAELYEKEHTQEAVKSLKDAGVNLLITHFFKGFGIKAEADDIKNAEKLIKLCHRENIKVGGYIGDTIVLETALSEESDAAEWIQRKESGDPVRYAGTQCYRYKWCMVNPAYFAYITKVLDRGISAGLDMIHFDNFLNKPEPESCHCRYCVEAFRDFLKAKYTPSELRERLGHADCTHLDPPTFTFPLYVAWQKEIIQDPATQEWIDFKCKVVADTYEKLAEYCRGQKEDIIIDCNPTGFWGENSRYLRSVDHVRQLPHGDFFWDESPNKYGLQKNGALRTNIISMKMGEKFDSRVFFYIKDDTVQLSEMKMGEALVFNNGCLGMVGFLEGSQVKTHAVYTKYVDLLQQKPEYFCKTKSLAKIAIYRNFPSFSYNSYEPYLQTILCQQALLQNHLPFDLTWDLNDLAGYQAVILPGVECLAGQEIEALVRFAEGGGKVVVIGNTGFFDQWRRKYPVWPFADHCKTKPISEVGKGHFARIDNLLLPDDAPGKDDREIWDDWFPVLDGKFWMLPKNDQELLSILSEFSSDLYSPFKSNAAKNTIVEGRIGGTDELLFIHIINYNLSDLGTDLKFGLNWERRIKDLRCLSPHNPNEENLSWSDSDQGGEEFSVKNDFIYSLLKVTLEP